MSKKVAIVFILILVGGILLYLNIEKVTVLKINGSAAITGFSLDTFTMNQYGLTPRVSAKFDEISRFNYMFTEKGKPRITHSRPITLPNNVNLTIIFILKTPTNKTIEFQPLKLGKGGIHNFTLIIGPDEGIKGGGTFYLTIVFKLKVTTPTGVTVVNLERTITIAFNLPQKSISISE